MSTTILIKKKLDNLRASTEFIEACFQSRQRIPSVIVHPVLHGDHKYLRVLRAAEMAAWDASLPLDVAQSFAQTVARSEAEGFTEKSSTAGARATR